MTATSKADAYRLVHRRLVGVLRGLSEEQLTTLVPACPGWRVRDVAAHLTGVATDMLEARFPTSGFDEWNGEQVDARASVPFADVVDEWETRAPDFANAMDAHLAAAAGNFVADVVSHDLDIRSALGLLGAEDAPELVPAIETFVSMLGAAVNGAGLGAVVLRTGDEEFVAGREDPAVTLTGSRFELLRLISGRRTEVEILGAGWEGDSSPYLPVLSPYPLPASSLGER